MLTRAPWPVVAILLLLPPMAVAGQKTTPVDRGSWELSVFVGSLDDRLEFADGGRNLFLDPDRNRLFGAALNHHFPVGVSLGVSGRYALLDMRTNVHGPTKADAYFLSGNAGYTLPLRERLDLYGQVGYSMTMWRPAVGDSETDFGWSYGGGVRLYLKETIALTGDYRATWLRRALGEVTLSLNGLTENYTFRGSSFSVGISYFFAKKDADGDRVRDGEDACPGTPARVDVDARGCPLDSDGEGVPDFQDWCPDTRAGARVNDQGCPMDGDGDGVFDGLDRCPDTPAGVEVDAFGCHTDFEAGVERVGSRS